MKKIATVEEYIEGFPEDVQEILQKVRSTIKTAAPAAAEVISYQIPTFVLHGNLIHYAGYKNHIGLYPGPSVIANFKDELSEYKQAKGTVQFPLHRPIPYTLIKKITAFSVKKNLEKNRSKNPKVSNKKICEQGHSFIKSSECHSCPICEKENNVAEEMLSLVGTPARRALQSQNIDTFEKLSKFKSECAILSKIVSLQVA